MPRHVDVEELFPDETEAAGQNHYKDAAEQSMKRAAEFVKTRNNPVIWFVGPGFPGEELVRFLKSIRGHLQSHPNAQIHVVERNAHVCEALRQRIEDENLPMPAWHNERIEEVNLPNADLVVMHHVGQYMNAENQRKAAERILTKMNLGARLHYTHQKRVVRNAVVDWYEGPRLTRQESVSTVSTSEPFHKAVEKSLPRVEKYNTRDPKVTYQIREYPG